MRGAPRPGEHGAPAALWAGGGKWIIWFYCARHKDPGSVNAPPTGEPGGGIRGPWFSTASRSVGDVANCQTALSCKRLSHDNICSTFRALISSSIRFDTTSLVPPHTPEVLVLGLVCTRCFFFLYKNVRVCG